MTETSNPLPNHGAFRIALVARERIPPPAYRLLLHKKGSRRCFPAGPSRVSIRRPVVGFGRGSAAKAEIDEPKPGARQWRHTRFSHESPPPSEQIPTVHHELPDIVGRSHHVVKHSGITVPVLHDKAAHGIDFLHIRSFPAASLIPPDVASSRSGEHPA